MAGGFFQGLFERPGLAAAFVFFLSVFAAIALAWEALCAAQRARRETKIRCRLVLAAVFVTLLAAEAAMRWSGRVATYAESRFGRYVSPYACDGRAFWNWPGSHVLKNKEYSFSRTVNSEGLSDREFPVAKENDEFRVIALGDSFTEGDGAEAVDSWPKALERSLNRDSSGRKFRVMNAGVCGSDPAYEFVLLRDRLLKYRPDLVVVLVNSSDVLDFAYRGGLERFHRDGSVSYSRPPAWEWLYGLSHLSRLVFHAQGYDQTLQKSSQKELLDRESLAKVRATLLEFSRLASAENFQLLAVLCPFQAEIDENAFLFDDFADEVQSRDGIAALNLRRYFIDEEKLSGKTARQLYWPLDRHPNAKGYAAMARGVEWKMEEMGLVASRSEGT